MFKKKIITEEQNFFNFLPEKNDINQNIGIKVSEFYDATLF